MLNELEQCWAQLLAEPAPGRGLLGRRISPAGSPAIYGSIELPGDRPQVLLMIPARDAALLASELPRTAGFTTRMQPDRKAGETAIVLTLKEPRHRALFGVLAADVVRHTLREPRGAAGSAFVTRLRRWQKFMERHPEEGLSNERQRGLVGELHFLLRWLAPVIGHGEAVEAWTGPSGADHDFRRAGMAVEVKTTSAPRPHMVEIANLRQLDDADVERLMLFHVALEQMDSGEISLPGLVDAARVMLAPDDRASEALEQRLLEAGYLDLHADRYTSAYRIHGSAGFRVSQDFPRLRPADVPGGVARVRYFVDLDACEDHRLADASIRSMLGELSR